MRSTFTHERWRFVRRRLAASHPAIAVTLNNFGLVYWRQGELSARRRILRAVSGALRAAVWTGQPAGCQRTRQPGNHRQGNRQLRGGGESLPARARDQGETPRQPASRPHRPGGKPGDPLPRSRRVCAGRGDVSADHQPDRGFARPAASRSSRGISPTWASCTGPRANGRKRSRRGSSSSPSKSATCRWNFRPGLNDRSSHSSSRYSRISKKRSRSTFNTHLKMLLRATLRSRRCCSAKAESSTRSPTTSGPSGIAPHQRTGRCWINWRASPPSSRQRCSASRRTSPLPIASGRSIA